MLYDDDFYDELEITDADIYRTASNIFNTLLYSNVNTTSLADDEMEVLMEQSILSAMALAENLHLKSMQKEIERDELRRKQYGDGNKT